MNSLKINLNNMKFSKEVTLEDLTNDDLANLIQDLVNELLKRSKNFISNITINDSGKNTITSPLKVESPYTYTCTAKDYTELSKK